MRRVRRICTITVLALLLSGTPTNGSICVSEICGGYSSSMRGVSIVPSLAFVVGSLSQSMPFLWRRGYTFSYPTYTRSVSYSSGWTGSYLRAGSSFWYLPH